MTRPADSSDQQLKLLASHLDLAELFGVSASAINNWQERRSSKNLKPPFPKPVEGRLYDVNEVLTWARRPDTPAKFPSNAEWWWRRTTEALQRLVGPAAARYFLAALVLERAALNGEVRRVRRASKLWESIVGSDEPDEALRAAARGLETSRPLELEGLLVDPLSSLDLPNSVIAEVVRRLDEVARLEGRTPLDQLETALAIRKVGHDKHALVTTTDDNLVKVVERAAQVSPTARTIYDPCAGEGKLVVVCAGVMQVEPRVFVQELDPAALRVARTRLLLAGLDADTGKPDKSSIGEDQFPTMNADLVVADPPVTPRSPLVDWVNHALGHLSSDGRAVIVLPAHAFIDMHSARRVKEESLENRLKALALEGQVDGVWVVPLRLRADVSSPLTVWEFRNRSGVGAPIPVRWPREAVERTGSSNRDVVQKESRTGLVDAGRVFEAIECILRDPKTKSLRDFGPRMQFDPVLLAAPSPSAPTKDLDDLEQAKADLHRMLGDLDVVSDNNVDAARRKLDDIRRLLES